MKPLPHTPAFLAAAKRIVWLRAPEAMALLIAHIGEDGLREAIDNAPPGIIDPRSWSYWNARIGRSPAPRLPRRVLV